MSNDDGLTPTIGLVDPNDLDYSLDCGECRACCFGIDGPIISDVESVDYECHEAEEGKWRLDQTEEGACIYLDEDGCTIYPTRPKVCQSFDCRSLVLTMDPLSLDDAVEGGKILPEVVEQGRSRMVEFNKFVDSEAFRKAFLA